MSRSDPIPSAPRVLGPLASFPVHLGSALAAGPWGPVRLLLLLPVSAGLLLVWVLHGLALLLDEIWFPGYRRIRVREPLFVVGLPRSGTSAMQEILADDPRHTTLRLWELVLAPAICERRVARRLARLDEGLGSPLLRLRRWVEARVFGFMEDVHPVDFGAPEEDYLLLAPVFGCFLLVVPFPRSARVWALTRIDDWPAPARRGLVGVYRALVRRHLHEARAESGRGDLRLLSKNPMFTPFVGTLLEAFPDARIVGCVRDPRKTVPSLLSSLEDGAGIFGWSPADPEYRDRFLEMLEDFGARLIRYDRELGDRFAALVLRDVRRDLLASVTRVYDRFDRPLDPAFRRALEQRASATRSHTSRHRYQLADYALDAEGVTDRFRDLMHHFRLDPSTDPSGDTDARVGG